MNGVLTVVAEPDFDTAAVTRILVLQYMSLTGAFAETLGLNQAEFDFTLDTQPEETNLIVA
ncbi:MAG: hypothetical protein R3C05_05270 [Pirellulaceae bacterium]